MSEHQAGVRQPYGSQDAPLQQVPVTLELITQDTGLNTNPEKWMHDHHWEAEEVTCVLGSTNVLLGIVVPVGVTRRIREITIRHAGTNNTVVVLLVNGTARMKIMIDVPAQTTRVWSSEDGRLFVAGEQPAVYSTDVTGGSTFVSCSGVEA